MNTKSVHLNDKNMTKYNNMVIFWLI